MGELQFMQHSVRNEETPKEDRQHVVAGEHTQVAEGRIV
jgi:hypothetical protein